MNNSTTIMSNSTPAPLDFTNQYVYIGCGIAAVVANIVVAIVLLVNKSLMVKSAFAAGLCLGDIINGLALFITGIKRIELTTLGVSNKQVHPVECLKGFSTLWLIGTQLPTVMMLIIGLERVVAVSFFAWYYKTWSHKITWILTGLVYLYVSGSIAAIWIINTNLPLNTTTSQSCTTPSVIGQSYASYHYGLAIMSGILAITTTIVSLAVMLTKKKALQKSTNNNLNMQKFMKKQWQITTSMTCIAAFDFFMVVIPNVLLLMTSFQIQFPPELKSVGSWSADLVCSRSTLSLFIYIIFNRDFRIAFLRCLGIKISSVQPFMTNQKGNERTSRISSVRVNHLFQEKSF